MICYLYFYFFKVHDSDTWYLPDAKNKILYYSNLYWWISIILVLIWLYIFNKLLSLRQWVGYSYLFIWDILQIFMYYCISKNKLFIILDINISLMGKNSKTEKWSMNFSTHLQISSVWFNRRQWDSLICLCFQSVTIFELK